MQPDPANLMTLPEWAAWMGWSSAGMAYQARKEGRVVMAPDGKRVLAAESKARYLATADPAKAGVAARHAAARARAEAAYVESDEAGGDNADQSGAGGYDYHSAKAEGEYWSAKQRRDDYLKSARELIPIGEHVGEFANAGVGIRAALEMWSAMLPPQLVGRDEAAIRATIADQVEQVLHQLSAQINGLAAALEEGGAL